MWCLKLVFIKYISWDDPNKMIMYIRDLLNFILKYVMVPVRYPYGVGI